MSAPGTPAFLDGLLRRYRDGLGQVDAIFAAMQSAGMIRSEADLDNDHIALRSFGVPGLGVQSAAKAFLEHGYEQRDHYRFEAKKLEADWFSPPTEDLPRVFISELCVDELSPQAQAIIRRYTDAVMPDASTTAIFESLPWMTPNHADYLALAEESEYASWTLCHGYTINHLTVSVHDLPSPYDNIDTYTQFIADQGFALNESGGRIKVSGDGLLKQSSTKAPLTDYPFSDGEVHAIAGAYVEFAERLPLDTSKPGMGRQNRRDGFETANADKIFESTFRR